LGFSFKYSYVKDALKAIISWSNISTATVIFFILWNWIHASTFPTCQWQFINGFINISLTSESFYEFTKRKILLINENEDIYFLLCSLYILALICATYSLSTSVTLVPSFYIGGVATWTKVVYITARDRKLVHLNCSLSLSNLSLSLCKLSFVHEHSWYIHVCLFENIPSLNFNS
jgi:hypothetical protein